MYAPKYDPKRTPSWQEWAVIVVLVVVASVACLILLGPLIADGFFQGLGTTALWLHLVGR